MEVTRPSIDNLPDEVLVEVFSYCSPKLMKIAALVCTRWNNVISQAPDLMKCFTLNLGPASSTKVNEALRINRRFQSLKTNKISPNICGFMESLNLRSLELTELVMERTAFSQIFAYAENLENLVIDNVRLADESDSEPRKSRLNHLKYLSMTQVQGDVFSFIETSTLKTYKEKIHDSTQLAPIVNFLMKQPSLKVLKLCGGNVDSCFDPDRFINAEFRLKHLTIIGGDMHRNSDHMKRFLSTQTSLKELVLQCKIDGSLLTFVLQHIRGLESLQIPTNFDDFKQLIADVKPLPAVRRLRIVTGLNTPELAKSYFKLFPGLKAVDLKSVPRNAGALPAGVFIELHDSLPDLEELHLADVYFPTRGYWNFAKLKEFHVGKICAVLPQLDEMFNQFIEDHAETLEKISIGSIHNASFAKGTTVESIKKCMKLQEIRIFSDSPMATRMLKKLSLDHPWRLVTEFPKTKAEDEAIEVKFSFPDDEALWRDKCQVWDDELVRELSTVENYGLNSFINMYK